MSIIKSKKIYFFICTNIIRSLPAMLGNFHNTLPPPPKGGFQNCTIMLWSR